MTGWRRIAIIIDTQKIKRMIEGGSLLFFVTPPPVSIWIQRQHHIYGYLSDTPSHLDRSTLSLKMVRHKIVCRRVNNCKLANNEFAFEQENCPSIT